MSKDKQNTNPITVGDARLVFLWAEVLPPLVDQQLLESSPLFFLTRGYLYRDAFDRARNGEAVDPTLEPPWLPKHKQKFWMRYLVQGNLADVTGHQAWDWLVPLRFSPGVRLTAEWFKGRSCVEGFFYPFGLGLAISFQWSPQLALGDFVSQAFELRRTGRFSVAGTTAPPVSLEEAAGPVLDSMRDLALGKGSSTGDRSTEPFTILTVTEGRGASPTVKLEQSPEIRLDLEALTNWRPDWPVVTVETLPDLATVCLPTKGTAPAGSVLYAQERGRAVWFPSLFSPALSSTHLLACYHRNLLFASLQVEAFAKLIRHTAARFAKGEQPVDLTSHHRAVLRIAAQQLSKLYRGDKGNTWRSASAKRQIRQTCFDDLQTILARLSEPALVP
jgi:hypothetical protein